MVWIIFRYVASVGANDKSLLGGDCGKVVCVDIFLHGCGHSTYDQIQLEIAHKAIVNESVHGAPLFKCRLRLRNNVRTLSIRHQELLEIERIHLLFVHVAHGNRSDILKFNTE